MVLGACTPLWPESDPTYQWPPEAVQTLEALRADNQRLQAQMEALRAHYGPAEEAWRSDLQPLIDWSEPFVIASTATATSPRNAEQWRSTLSQVLRRVPEARFVLVGSAPEPQPPHRLLTAITHIRENIESLGLEPWRVQFYYRQEAACQIRLFLQ